MKTILAALAAIAFATPAFAQAAKVPTGYEVPGKTDYYLNHEKRVVQIDCNTTKALTDQKWKDVCDRSIGRGERFGIDRRSGAKE